MPIKDKETWEKAKEANTDPYGSACIRVASKAMEILDKESDLPINAYDIISRTNMELDAGITGFMAGAVANIISSVHSEGEAFRKSWNDHYGIKESKGTVNPAVLTIDA